MSDAAATIPPVWDTITEEIVCPLCDYNLRGLTEPRCPECGFRFEWPALLDPARRRHPFLFEHHPEANVRSYFKTLTASLRPWRFWAGLHPAQPSRPRRLLLYWAVPTLPFALVFLTGLSLAFVALNRRVQEARAWTAAWINAPAAASQRAQVISQYGSVKAFLDETDKQLTISVVCQEFWYDFIRNPARAIGREAGLIMVCSSIMLAWTWITLLALLVFQISMRRARVRNVHVLRCVIYAGAPAAYAGIFLFMISVLWMLVADVIPRSIDLITFLNCVVLLCLIYPAVILASAYRRYLKFDHPYLTVLATQVILLLFGLDLLSMLGLLV